MNETDLLIDDLLLILGEVVVGTDDNPRKLRRIDLALERTRDHRSDRAPALHHAGETGGSSSPSELEERRADVNVGRAASRDLPEIRRLQRDLAVTARLLRSLVVFHTATVDHSLLPGEPECRSCARPGKVGKQQYPGHKDVPVYEKAKKHGLCRWCWDHARAEGVEQGLTGLGALPPVDVIDIYHRVGARAAGLELAKRAREQERRKQKKAS